MKYIFYYEQWRNVNKCKYDEKSLNYDEYKKDVIKISLSADYSHIYMYQKVSNEKWMVMIACNDIWWRWKYQIILLIIDMMMIEKKIIKIMIF